jgi:hypothetical protein
MGAVTFFNRTNNGKWTGTGHEIEVTVYEGLSPIGKSQKIKVGDSWSYERKTDIKGKIRSCTVTKGWEPFEQKSYGRGAMSYYVVESNRAMGFNVALEWPPRFPDKL